ncbi:hypothetical protein [Streptomyces hiroshimensis]|uniref:Uncharacterized protein n=1 Tax=Streptomyces hiroshimensis TaxID=66424 RepID=A0ABQ2YJ08_9ACTN|nr:hypothetical protein [Streptomyces hiroshimensis]GGX83467.1 hypothetical protein GCM10010324_31280 [Streptomyces hiroshimensis]
MKRILLTAAVASLLAFAAPALDPAPYSADGRATAAAEEGGRPPVLQLPTTPRCSQHCGGPTDTSWGGSTGQH